jgi:phosphoadenosine phosphosulfate reductase
VNSALSEVARPATPPIDGQDDSAVAANVANAQTATKVCSELSDRFGALDLFGRLAAVRLLLSGRIVFTTSFGLEDQAVAHALFAQGLAIDVATLDTGRLFAETHEVWAETERRYGARVSAYAPDHADLRSLLARQGADGFRASITARQECCAIRKVAPLQRALAGGAAWITGMRADQSLERSTLAPASFDAQHRLVKVNPLFDWTRERALAFVRTHSVPYNTLHDRGFLSIGCAPCTRAVAPGEGERAGRWWWETEAKKECGLHIASDGRVTRLDPPQL